MESKVTSVCCGKKRTGKFCPDCGKKIIFLSKEDLVDDAIDFKKHIEKSIEKTIKNQEWHRKQGNYIDDDAIPKWERRMLILDIFISET